MKALCYKLIPMLCFITVLSAPKNLQLSRRTSSSITISWERPSNARGNMTLYTIIYWKGFVRELSTKKGVEYQSGDYEVEYTLTGLDPVTSYNIQVFVHKVFHDKSFLFMLMKACFIIMTWRHLLLQYCIGVICCRYSS